MLDWNRIMTTTFVRNSEEKNTQKQLILRNSLTFFIHFLLYISPSLSYVGSKRNVAWKMRVYHFSFFSDKKFFIFQSSFTKLKILYSPRIFFLFCFFLLSFLRIVVVASKKILLLSFIFLSKKHFTVSYNEKRFIPYTGVFISCTTNQNWKKYIIITYKEIKKNMKKRTRWNWIVHFSMEETLFHCPKI